MPLLNQPVTTSAALLAALDVIGHETTHMLNLIDNAPQITAHDLREVKRHVLNIRGEAHLLIEWLSQARLEAPKN